jgi:uncharacterized protein
MTCVESIIDRYYGNASRLRTLLTVHSRLVADKALRCARKRGLDSRLDLVFVEEAAMLHDIGIFRCDAPGILCHGELPYICHGTEGRAILDCEGLPRHALVCERHTGAGLTVDDIVSQNLPLPLRDMTPRSAEERLICYADKFYSKSGDPTEEKPLEKVIASMARHGEDTLARFMRLHEEFGE